MEKRKAFTRSERIGLGLWMLALDFMADEARKAAVEPYPEDSEFACQWWNDIYDETQCRGWYWAMAVRDHDRPLLSY